GRALRRARRVANLGQQVPGLPLDVLGGDQAQALGRLLPRALLGRLSDEVAGRAPEVGANHSVTWIAPAGEIALRIRRAEDAHRGCAGRAGHVHGAGVAGEEEVEGAD